MADQYGRWLTVGGLSALVAFVLVADSVFTFGGQADILWIEALTSRSVCSSAAEITLVLSLGALLLTRNLDSACSSDACAGRSAARGRPGLGGSEAAARKGRSKRHDALSDCNRSCSERA